MFFRALISHIFHKKDQKPIDLLVMCAEDMIVAHPYTDFNHFCSLCNRKVGIYPSGQSILKKSKDKVKIKCNRCLTDNDLSKISVPSPQILDEIKQSVPMKHKGSQNE